MGIYAVEIKETLSRVIYVAADDENEALRTAAGMYTTGEVVLDAGDYVGYELNTVEE